MAAGTDPPEREILFEATIKLSREEIDAVEEGDLAQAVQNVIGDTGAVVTCVFEGG